MKVSGKSGTRSNGQAIFEQQSKKQVVASSPSTGLWARSMAAWYSKFLMINERPMCYWPSDKRAMSAHAVCEYSTQRSSRKLRRHPRQRSHENPPLPHDAVRSLSGLAFWLLVADSDVLFDSQFALHLHRIAESHARRRWT